MKKQATTTVNTTAKRTRKSNAQPQSVGEVAQQVVSEAKAQAAETKPEQNTKKIVDIEFNATDMEAATDKAQLLIAHDDKGNRFKFWLPKSQINIIPDADEPGKMICRLAAWLYYRAGLNAVYPAVRWGGAATAERAAPTC